MGTVKTDGEILYLHIDAPNLKFVEENHQSSTRCGVKVFPKRPETVTELSNRSSPLDPTAYPGLRGLWLRENIVDGRLLIKSLEDQIQHCPELEVISYSNRLRNQ